MDSLPQVKTKISKSRIPVAVMHKRTSHLYNSGKYVSDKKLSSTLQTSKTAKLPVLPKVTEKKFNSQPEKSERYARSRNINDARFNINFKPSLTTSTKSDSDKKDNRILKTNIQHHPKNKESLATFAVKSNVNKKLILPSHKAKMKTFGGVKTSVDNVQPSCKKTDVTDSNKMKICTPKICDIKENEMCSKPDWFSAQKDIKFEADEFYRKMILSNRELSPSIGRLMPGLRQSSLQAQRPSAYQKFEVSADPLKDAVKALENACLSVKRTMKAPLKENKMPSSPFRDRASFYTPCADPKQEVMKSLEELKLKRLQKNLSKSCKKVTFNLNIQGCTPKNAPNIESNPFRNSEVKLMQINEKSEENTPNSPQSEKTNVFPLKQNQSTALTSKVNDTDCDEHLEIKTTCPTDESDCHPLNMNKRENFESETQIAESSAPPLTLNRTPEKLSLCGDENISSQITKKADSWTTNLICDYKTVVQEMPSDCQETSDSSEQKFINNLNLKSAKVYTPRPVSLSSYSKPSDSYSPEFLVCGKSKMLAGLAPICTPLVLKSIAKSNTLSPEEANLSPVRLKLNFNEVEKDTPQKWFSKNQTAVSMENIITFQKKLDDLADRECCLLLLNEDIPIICGRYLTNPVAFTLSEGDDMHFIPIQG